MIFLDFLLEEEMIDILTYCLQNPDSDDVDSKKQRLKEIGKELFNDGGVDEIISTRRLVHIIRAFGIWKNRLKAIKVCLNRFDDETKASFLELYDKIDAEVDLDNILAD